MLACLQYQPTIPDSPGWACRVHGWETPGLPFGKKAARLTQTGLEIFRLQSQPNIITVM
jgi:hypothetical protein